MLLSICIYCICSMAAMPDIKCIVTVIPVYRCASDYSVMAGILKKFS